MNDKRLQDLGIFYSLPDKLGKRLAARKRSPVAAWPAAQAGP
jgi:hypothetical protein